MGDELEGTTGTTSETSGSTASVDGGASQAGGQSTGATDAGGAGASHAGDAHGAGASGAAPVPTLDADGNPIAPQAPVYTPNLKYKVRNDEFEFDPELKEILKNKEIEEKFRTLYCKAKGLDAVFRPKVQELDTRLQETTGKYEAITTQVQDIAKDIRERGDLDSLLEAFGVSPEMLKQHTIRLLDREQLPADQRAVYDQERQFRHQAKLQQAQISQYEQQINELAAGQRAQQLESVLTGAAKDIATQVDARHNQSGYFREKVVKHAQWAWQNQQRDLSAQEAVNEVAAMWAPFLSSQAQGSQAQSPASPNGALPQTQVAAPTIPAVAARTSSPARRAPKSLDDLRRMANDMAASG